MAKITNSEGSQMLSGEGTNILVVSIMALPFLYEFSQRFRLTLKFILYYSLVMTVSVLCIPFIIWRPGDVKNTLIATSPLHIINTLLGLHYEVRGKEHMTPDRPAIVIANHQSSIDFLGMVHIWPMLNKISAIAKKELFYAMPFGFTAWLCGTRFIDRRNPDKAKESMNIALEYIKENNIKLWIFPEGTRNMEDEMLPFKKGAFHLAVEGQIPILPIVYSSYRGFLNFPLKMFNPGGIFPHLLPPTSASTMKFGEMKEIGDDCKRLNTEVGYRCQNYHRYCEYPISDVVHQ
ncbi:unnamed protein product, partial [Meganyctiphanes norvegica]